MMRYSIKTEQLRKIPCDALVIPVSGAKQQSALTDTLDRATRHQITGVLTGGLTAAKIGDVLLIPSPRNLAARSLLLVGTGKRKVLEADEYGRMIAAVSGALARTRVRDAVFALTDVPVRDRELPWKVRCLVETMEDESYRFDELKRKPARPRLKRIGLAATSDEEQSAIRAGLRTGEAVAHGVALAKRLGNLPGNICTPTFLADQARELATEHELRIAIRDEEEMRGLGMGAFLSVARGSREPAKLIELEYRGADGVAPIVLIGKGLTFDAGGISIKPAAKMDEMKFDMCGGAAVLGILCAVARMGMKINVVGLIPASENLPDGAANKPGDIVTSMSGQTIEILNTDAEGRLLLCDVLTYAERFNPGVVIDMATLTGACVVALGEHASGLFSNDDTLADDLIAAGLASGDRAWRLPLWKEYEQQLESNFADLANVGGRDAGAVTAACFLSRFASKLKWAHLDIAGTAWKGGKAKGATGRPVPLVTEYLIRQSATGQPLR